MLAGIQLGSTDCPHAPQGVLFLWLHTIPIAALFGSTPHILHHFGQPENLTCMVGPYLWALMPAVWIDAIFR